MTYKLVVSDLDGTLLNFDHQVSPYTIHVIQALIDQGIFFVIATGRHFVDVQHIRNAIAPQIYLITANGARIHDHTQMIYQQNIEPQFVQALLRPEFIQDTVVNIYQEDKWLIDQHLPWLLAAHHVSNFQYELFNPLTLSLDGINKIFYIADHHTLLSLKTRIEACLGTGTLMMTFSIPECLEVMSNKVSKGNALQQVAALHGVTLAECMAFGDGLNDYELLARVGKGLIMKNAHDALKNRLPQLEMIERNINEGVARYLATYYQVSI